MHYFKFLFLAIPFVFISCSESPVSSPKEKIITKSEHKKKATPKVQNVNAQQFHNLIAHGTGIVLDVRTPGETAQGSIENASFVDINDRTFNQKTSRMQKDVPIYVYCASGNRSSKAANVLIRNGFKEIYNLSGGIRSWRSAGLPVTAPSKDAIKNVKQLKYSEFEKMLQTTKPVLIDFHTQWCAPCKKMNPIVDELITEYKGKAEILKIDVDQSEEVANKLNIEGVPVFILFENGKETWRHSGLISKEDLQKRLNSALE